MQFFLSVLGYKKYSQRRQEKEVFSVIIKSIYEGWYPMWDQTHMNG